MLDKDTAMQLYCENREQLRHHESQITSTLNIFYPVIAAVFGIYLTTSEKLDATTKIAILSSIIFLSAYGWLYVGKLSERANLHISRSHGILKELAENDHNIASVVSIITTSDKEHNTKYKIFRNFRLHRLWQFSFIVAIVAAVALILQSLYPWLVNLVH